MKKTVATFPLKENVLYEMTKLVLQYNKSLKLSLAFHFRASFVSLFIFVELNSTRKKFETNKSTTMFSGEQTVRLPKGIVAVGLHESKNIFHWLIATRLIVYNLQHDHKIPSHSS